MGRKAKQPRAPATLAPKDREPTAMGRRILTLMQANYITGKAELARRIGVSRQTFQAWLYNPINAENVAALPLLKCADVLNSDPRFILGESDDPRPRMALSYQEMTLVQAYRDLSEKDQERLLKNAADWQSESQRAPSQASPFRVPERERPK
jgi:transcriptional regulator with XRE-family HTH domain